MTDIFSSFLGLYNNWLGTITSPEITNNGTWLDTFMNWINVGLPYLLSSLSCIAIVGLLVWFIISIFKLVIKMVA